MSECDYTNEATKLFTRFAERHDLCYDMDTEAPIELLWTFPVQEGLTFPITLGLQNGDEINFGVSDFWSYFFPFEDTAQQVERVLDAWMIGEARIAITGPWGRVLQLWDHGRWTTVYRANRYLPLWRKPKRTLENMPLSGM